MFAVTETFSYFGTSQALLGLEGCCLPTARPLSVKLMSVLERHQGSLHERRSRWTAVVFVNGK